MRPEQDAFIEQLYHASFHELEVYAYALLKNRSDAETAVQDAFHTACAKIDDIMGCPNPVGWMKKTIKNIAQNLRKRKMREAMLVMHFADLLDDVGAEDPKEFELHEQYRSILTKGEYDLLVSVYINGTPPVEKARELGISIWACYKRIDRMLDKLRRGLENEKNL